MMHRVSLLILWLLSFMACAQSESIKEVSYTTMSRIQMDLIRITEDSIIISKKQRGETISSASRTIHQKEWKSMLREFNSIELSQIPNLESPSNKRTFDGAKHSHIEIITIDGRFEHRFDDEQPHEQLKSLLDCILKLKDKS